MKKVKLLFVAEELAINGASVSLLRLLKNLPKDQYDISLFLFNHGGVMTNDIPDGIRLLSESIPYKIHRQPLNQSILFSIKKGRPDLTLYRILVAVHRLFNLKYRLWPFLPQIKGKYDVAISYSDGFTAPMIQHKVDSRKKVCWIHTIYSKWPQPEYVYEALRQCDMRVPVSMETGKDLDRILGIHSNQNIVHNITDAEACVKLSKMPCDFPLKKGVTRIVSVGRVATVKNFHLIPKIVEILNGFDLRYEWIIVGNGDKLNELKVITKEKGLEEQVHWIGEKTNPMPYIKSADVFVNPSQFESWGMTVSEALTLGVPTIVSDIPVFAEQISHEYNGLICDNSPHSIADAIYRVLTDSELNKLLRRNSIKYPFTKKYVIGEFNHMIGSLFND